MIVAETRLATAGLDALKGAEKGFIKVGFGLSFLLRIAPPLSMSGLVVVGPA